MLLLYSSRRFAILQRVTVRCLQELVLDLIGPDLQAFVPPVGQKGSSAGPHAVHEIHPELCATCRQRHRSIVVRLHACGYEASALDLHEPDIDLVCMFHPGLAAEQPQSIEGATRKVAKHAARDQSVVSGRKRKHRLQDRNCVSESGQDTGQRKGRQLEELLLPLAPGKLDPCRAAFGGQFSSRDEEMPSLRQAWVSSFPKLASLTCPLLVTAFSMAGVTIQLYVV